MIGRIKPYNEVILEQQKEHGKRVMAREVQNGYGAYGCGPATYGWRDGLATPLRDLRTNKDVED